MKLERKCFTLIEAAIVAALFSVVGITLLATFSSGVKIWNKMYKNDEEENISIFLDKISRDLHNSIGYDSINFTGDKTSVRFATFVTTRSKIDGLSDNVGEVNYYWDKDNYKIFKTARNLSDIYQKNKGLAAVVLDNISGFNLSYCFYDSKGKKYSWLNKWDKKGVPAFVKLNISVHYNNKTVNLRRIIEIPRGINN